MKKYMISEEEYAAVKCAIKENKDKRIDRRLQVIKLRYEGFKYKEIAEKLDYHPKFIGQLCREFKMYGIEEYITQTSHTKNSFNSVMLGDYLAKVMLKISKTHRQIFSNTFYKLVVYFYNFTITRYIIL